MACKQVGLTAVFVATCLSAASGVVWIKSAGGSSCDTACSARGGCVEDSWPTSEEEFAPIAKEAGQTCETTQHGGAPYDPSTDGHHCGWGGPDEAQGGETRCASKGDHSTYRICPALPTRSCEAARF